MKTKIIKYYFFIFFGFTYLNSEAQTNLVLNPSFEDVYKCPCWMTCIEDAKHWYQPIKVSTSDLFHSCNALLTQSPRTGDAYAGICLYYFTPNSNYREYICGTLSSPLIKDETYCVSFYVSLAEPYSVGAIENIGIYFSKDSIKDKLTYSNPVVLNVTPYYENDKGIISDSINWVLIRGSIIAKGDEMHFVIGNFKDYSSTNKIRYIFNYSNFIVYYLIDDVSVTIGPCPKDPDPPVPAVPDIEISNVFTPNGDRHNDVFSIKNAEYWQLNIQVYNRWGNLVFQSKNNSFWDGKYKDNPCSDGVYIYMIEAVNERNESKSYRGSVTLMR